MPKIDLDSLEQTNRTGYPPPFNEQVAGRWYRRLAPAGGLTEFGASHVTLKPGAWSSQRHWHNGEDEFLVMLSGEAVLVEDEGRTVLRAGRLRGLAQGQHQRPSSCERKRRGLHVRRASAAVTNTGGGYSDIDMMFTAEDGFVHKDGAPY